MKKRKKRRQFQKQTQQTLVFSIVVCFILLALGTWSLLENVKYMKHSTNDKMAQYAHHYNWSYLDKSEKIYRYEDKNYYSRFGIDVSVHQGEIDWAKVKKAGVQFAYIRLGYRGYQNGYLSEDTTFRYNIQEALKQKLPVGVYFFSQAINEKEAKEEAEFVLKRIRSYPISLPVVYDLETAGEGKNNRIGSLTKEDMTKHAIAFMKHIKNNGYEAMSYSSTQVYGRMYQLDVIQKYPVWIAEYDQVVKYPYQFRFWQYSSKGKIDGIHKPVDLNLQFIRK
ncbi:MULTISPECIES: glycoside hydrolase family 25 protein [Terrabacteria group]|uniref:glycoside hydrolase family 25 protein n=1 Tax=Bacillati TaxID=1783272 RepID=UPI001C6E3624|nr:MULTISPECIES: glycoside hydrolase family 25 protein [Terrabacteria group]MBW9212557.1 glycoside hydrolase family 25 protein [Trueperella sp. zg.1013]